MMEKMILLVLSVFYLGVCGAQLIQNGQCNEDIQLQADFNLTGFSGKWHIIRRAENPIYTADCSFIELTPENNGISVYNRAVQDNFLEETRANATLQNGTAKFTITVDSESFDFWILTTDYQNFAIAYGCVNDGAQRRLYIWQMGRMTSYPTNMMEALMNQTLFTTFGVTSDALVTVDNSGNACEILPELPRGQPVVLPGQCNPNISVVQDFNVAEFMGVWHQISSYYTINQLGTCNRAEYTLSSGLVDVVNSEVVNQTLVKVAGNATLISSDNSARLLVTLEVIPGVYAQSELFILDTDYTNYAVSYTCVDLPNNERQVNSWILSRNRQLSPTAEIAVNRLIRSEVDLNNRFFIPSNQSYADCFFYPEALPNVPVVYRGQCEDDDVQAMPDFDPVRYMGLWHNIENYPAEFQFGTCNNAYYTLINGTVDVFNTQVVNQTLATINGVATVASTDGSAKLSVIFPIPGSNLTIPANYWVLGTDYDSYALVYSCSNINNDEKRVSSWKLSRSKQLSNNATAAIDNIIDAIPVLDERYFDTNDQSREGCFYYPDPQPGVPVKFPGQCDESVQVVTNFDLTQFQGTWHEIQAYPKEQKPGECVSHAFTATSNQTFGLITSSVTDQFLGSNNSTVSLVGADGSARMTITIRVNNQDVNIPYWILDTDYVNYALAYSCVNVDDDFKMVYSWKLSRTKQLSPASNIAINAIISNVTVLQQRYFETVDQSDSACFYLPDLGVGEPVILNGQCDPYIPVVDNFDASAYLGRWRLIESYASDFQSGTCNDATYSLSPTGSVVVYNTQVVNQTLSTVIGSAILATNDSSGKLLVNFPGASRPSEYWILDTDYTSYSLVYSCYNINSQQRRVWSWKLSRTRDLSETAIVNMNRVINSIEVLNNRYYELLDQSDDGCFYYPTAGANTPVIFRGQCDPNIPVVTNFNAASYMNLWHDIESYPTVSQQGTCNNARYTLVNGTVDVYNTQVIGQRLDTIQGTARLATNDGSAKLLVNFPGVGNNSDTESPYWVLATDYTNYALVYSCVNLDDETRQVWSWKLSRTKQLSPNAVTEINNAISSIDVLDNRYYTQRDQTRSGCFYFPEPQPGTPVVFPGQCDLNIQAVSNFNMTNFQGTWYETAAYPKEQQTGQCVNHEFSLNASNVFSLTSSNVINQVLGISNSRVTFASAQDSSGRLTITLNVGGSEIVIPYWILSTDYENYALAYSCVNLNNDFTGVYSWKLSRTKQLSNADNIAINNAMANIPVLDNRYYEPIDQSDSACFYLPDPIPNEPVEFVGQCDENIPVVQNFTLERYLGRWRMIESYPQASQTGSCNDATYSLNPDNTTVDVYNTQVVNQQLDFINGRAVAATNDGSAKFSVYFPNTTEPAPYWVLDTDYDSYALVYSCRNLDNNRRRVTSWKLSRTSQLTPNAIQRISQVVNSINVLNDRYFAPVSQSDQACFYYPTPGLTTPVIFRGQCDQNIPVVTNFNATRYEGLWHDTAAYPSISQEGTCNNALYTLVGGTVDVYNTQVINQTLDTIRGVARLATTDGTAKLIVNFPIAGTNQTTETSYWVLSTDYDSYSLVYTCVNIDDERRQVWSWKLSRTKQLTPNAMAIINNVVNSIQVLDNRYYNQKDQSREGCFYYPEPQPGVPVVFPGQCSNDIQVVSNFNMTAFQGTWYEIEAYPKEQQIGHCVNHEYSLNTSNVLDLISSNVFNQALGISNSRVTFASAQDSSGKLTITLNTGGSVITIPFWILNTDYTSYALAYSCVNLNEDFTGVYSWKLSRTKQLTTAANNIINGVISNITVLDNIYYEPIDQSDAACFYLPDPIPNEPVEFVGQCDENIPVVQNFTLERYLGRWRMIESYPQASQTGSCNDATYSLNPDNTTVDVYNTQVVNQQLDFINGRAVAATNDGSAKFSVYFPNTTQPAAYWVLDTDYDTFALVYSCRNLDNNRRRVTSWKLSRTDELTPNAVQRINEVINNTNVLDSRYYTPINQTDQACFYLPTPEPNSGVIFRGQCDQNITVVNNFDAGRYLGTWHNIYSYPSEFQGGTCNNAYYSLGDGVVDVFNTQVVNQTLDTITGIAAFAEGPQTAKLTVSFPVAGTNLTTSTPYWVLATDYDSYSLVYTCVNLDTERRRVWSWKLSRTKQLTANAQTAINNVVNTIPVLNDQYYYTNDQSDAGCFYYPEPEPGVPVVFPGQCNQSIQAVPNFNMSAFQGVWHEISAYPKEQQTGQCVNHDYTQDSANSLSLVSSNVRNQLLSLSNSNVTYATAQDSSGKLTITLTANGTTIIIPYWVLSTDYTDYALAYSCVNLNASSRAVYSWKLSRSKALSTAANTVINNKISEIDVLDNIYYEPIDQSDAACFYLPDPIPNEPVEFVGQCDENIPVVQNFTLERYLGRWRMIESYPQASQTGSCNDATYSLNPDNTTVDVYNTQVVNQQLDFINGRAVAATNDGSAKFSVYFPNTTVPAPYWVLDTDYDTFALVYSCRNLNNNRRRVTSWKLSRTDELTPNAVQRINQVINNTNVLDSRYYAPISQTDQACFYLPTPEPNSAVIFRGQCDQNITVVSNFDAGRYLGTWHNIYSYPSEFQGGTCNNAYYSLGDGVVDVFNTQVVNQTLDTITGIAAFAEGPQTAKLTVSFPVAGTNLTTSTPYWVLATDYDSYSLVYTCVNLDTERRRVWSWKLSRTKQLTANAQTAINNVVNTIPVLNDQYYYTNDQSDAGCFYYPEPEPGVPVVFPGQCNQSIQAVPNFNMSAFQGVWHEISAYPKEQQTGQCVNHDYTQDSANSLSLVSSNVRNQLLSLSNSNVTYATAQDSSGKLTITLTANGTTITIPYWVLSTDYTDYALAYSCVNLNASSRAVYSWKLSRSKALSTAANTAINNKISEIDVLDNIYYEPINQSDAACFFLPEIDPGQPAVFIGQCDPNIPVVQNFRPEDYVGRWRMIETYASDFQDPDASCIDATYTINPTGIVDVYNTQVINQTLDTINGTATLATTDGSAKLLVNFPNAPSSSDYWILDTDYTSFALVYSCRNINSEQRRVWTWKLSRTRELTANATARINQVISTIDVLNERYYMEIDHSDNGCFYFPTPDGNPVVFRGQCNDSIPVVTNFDAVAYMNTWNDIESYPVRFQDGTCPTATYTLTNAGVEVFNTQVVGQQMDTINGLAVPSTNDTSAKLTVSFPIAGTNLTTYSPYWVLATDYDNYALVYSCTNIDGETSRVGSWKLSRTKSLTPASVTAINNVINNVQVLRQDYYVARGHSEEDCFYYPDNNGGPVEQRGQCDFENLNIVANFSANLFSGPWYEISRYPSELQEGECVSNEFNVTNQEFRMTKRIVSNERQSTFSGPAVLASDGRGVLNVTLTSDAGDTFETVIYVLDVDYNDFALLHSCRNINNASKQVYSWKLSRSSNGLSPAAVSRINEIVSNTTDLFEGYYEVTDQTINGCFHYPTFTELPEQIELMGSCDQSIQAQANFDVQAYLGKWHEIESYPQPFQNGQCARATYTAGSGGTVNVMNSQVVNRTLDVQSATAVVASNDGSGLLEVTFVVGNVTNVVNYYVLETDYTSYALVYSCRNLPNGYRQVSSWKLSRNITLPSHAIPIIENRINNTQGLQEEYYRSTSQTEDACFYIPEVNKNEAPLFRGQCEDIVGVQDFNVQRYLGWWHEIESYPTSGNVGTCVSSELRQIGNDYIMTDTSVFGLTAQVNTSTVTATNNGRLRKTYSNGQVVDLWVMATDYDTYSLLYSCENVNEQQMRVWSAKHSKTRELSQAAQDAMNSVINSIRTLETQFFLPINQSDSACFHYPEQTGNQIILPGQCDLNIPVVQSFNAAQYSGTWYQIERYPQIHENGTCVGARYTLNENTGVVTVLNWQVTNGVLDTVEGTATVNSTDGSAKLMVNLPIRGTDDPEPPMVSMELYVLSTDYISYSLAYSCVNVGPYQRAVGAWKLSRTRTLTTEGTNAINAYMATRDELNEPYFIQVQQNDDCDEPSSAILFKSSIIIILICSIIHKLL